MKPEKISEIFKQGLGNLKENGIPALMEYLDMCAAGNIFSLAYENQVLVFQQNKSATDLHSYEKWKEHGRVPRRGSAIYLFPNGQNSMKWCFDIKDTVARSGNTKIYHTPEFTEADKEVLFTILHQITEEKVDMKECIKILTQTYVRAIFKTGYESNLPAGVPNIIYTLSNYVILKRMGEDYKIFDSAEEQLKSLSEENLMRVLDLVQLVSSRFIGMVYRAMLDRMAEEKEGGKGHDGSSREESINRGRNEAVRQHDDGGSNGISGMRRTGGAGDSGRSESGPSGDGQAGSGFHRGEIPETRTDAPVNRQTETDREGEAGRSGRADGEDPEGIHAEPSQRGLPDQPAVSERSEGVGAGDSESGSTVPEHLGLGLAGQEELAEDIVEDSYAQMSLFDFMDGEKPPKKEEFPVKTVPKTKIETKNIPMDYIEQTLLRNSGKSRLRIEQLYKGSLTRKERANKIKKEYGMGGCVWPLEGYGLHGYDTLKQTGIRLQWRDEEGEKEGIVLWSNVELIIETMIGRGSYISDEERQSKTDKEKDMPGEPVIEKTTAKELLSEEKGSGPGTPAAPENARQETEQIKGQDYFYPENWHPNDGSDKERFKKMSMLLRH